LREAESGPERKHDQLLCPAVLRAITLSVLGMALGSGCGPFFDGVGGSMPELADRVERAGDTGRAFPLASITDFEWDKVYFFSAYTPAKAIRKQLGFDWDGAEAASLEVEGQVAVVFVRDGEVVEAFNHDVGGGDLNCLDRSRLARAWLTPPEAVFRVERIPFTEQDPPYLSLVLLDRPRNEREARLTAKCRDIYL
jgi:hypothetical protein